VALGERSYPIHIGARLLHGDLIRQYTGREIMLVSNTKIAPLYLERVRQSLGDARIDEVILPDGEQYKTLSTLETIFDALLAYHHDRTTTVVAVGGGVVGDIAGFAAACYQRGVNFVQVPTTLLAQVDSSVGGKTAVNHPLGKNMIGAFHQPRAVIIDTDVLATLPAREFAAGLAEVVKYGLIRDAGFFDWLETHLDQLLRRDDAALMHCIETSCRNKAEVVAEDETEGGVRAILNLGHTFGHAIETHTGYSSWLHGEAIAAGMVMACEFSTRLGWLDNSVTERTISLLSRCNLPVVAPTGMTAGAFLDLMSHDKKVRDGQLRLVLLRGLGKAVVTADYDQAELKHFLADYLTSSEHS
jgi:3-dehydroquinate synthase